MNSINEYLLSKMKNKTSYETDEFISMFSNDVMEMIDDVETISANKIRITAIDGNYKFTYTVKIIGDDKVDVIYKMFINGTISDASSVPYNSFKDAVDEISHNLKELFSQQM